MSETYFCSCEAGCDAVPSSGCAAPSPSTAAAGRAGPAPPALPPAALAQPPARPGGNADFLLVQSESLFTSGISQRHIKESKQVQVNHEMVTF